MSDFYCKLIIKILNFFFFEKVKISSKKILANFLTCIKALNNYNLI